jgi:hypothetical protein
MPSDAALQENFHAHETEFHRLAQMSNEDSHLVVIKSTFTSLDTDASWPRTNVGISEVRWNEYRNLFHELGIEGGISRPSEFPGAVFFDAYGSGGVLASSNKGYVYSPSTLSPIVKSLDSMPKDFGASGHALAFTPLTNQWYLYREEY